MNFQLCPIVKISAKVKRSPKLTTTLLSDFPPPSVRSRSISSISNIPYDEDDPIDEVRLPEDSTGSSTSIPVNANNLKSACPNDIGKIPSLAISRHRSLESLAHVHASPSVAVTKQALTIPVKTMDRDREKKRANNESLASIVKATAASLPPPKKNKKDQNKYQRKDLPPYIVHIQHDDPNNDTPLHPMMISRLINGLIKKYIREIRKIGRNKILVKFITPEAANNTVDHQILKDKHLAAYIPTYRVMRVGIIIRLLYTNGN